MSSLRSCNTNDPSYVQTASLSASNFSISWRYPKKVLQPLVIYPGDHIGIANEVGTIRERDASCSFCQLNPEEILGEDTRGVFWVSVETYRESELMSRWYLKPRPASVLFEEFQATRHFPNQSSSSSSTNSHSRLPGLIKVHWPDPTKHLTFFDWVPLNLPCREEKRVGLALQSARPKPIDLDIPRFWLQRCRREHVHLDETSLVCSAATPVLPDLWMIDCYNRQVVPAPENCSYVCLSYVWSGQGNADTVDSGNNSEKLPALVDNCVRVTSLGMTYL